MLLALVCVAVMVAGFAAMAKMIVVERNHQRQNELRAQAEWLAEAGLDRAIARLHADPDWSGETWAISADELAGRGDARVVIEVVPSLDVSPGRHIRVVADYPADSPTRARAERYVSGP